MLHDCQIPDVDGLSPKDNIRAWTDRKAFIHNLGHATAAYCGACRHPDAVYVHEVLEDPEVVRFVRAVMRQSAAVLRVAYSADFTPAGLEAHIDDLLSRFRNRALRDTLFRVGQDRPRKLGPDDRFVGALRLAQAHGMPCDRILEAIACAFRFGATDENGCRSQSDILFDRYLEQGIPATLETVCGFDPVGDRAWTEQIVRYVSSAGCAPKYRHTHQRHIDGNGQ